MDKTKHDNYSLLNQEEIDALVGFLMEKKDSLDSSVMNQKSIDRLIYLLQSDSNHIQRTLFDPLAHVNQRLLEDIHFRKNRSQECTLLASVDEEKQQLLVWIHNEETGEDMEVTPETLTEGDGKYWGSCMSPTLFVRLVQALAVKCSRAVYDTVCSQYAKCMFGDADYQIPSIYLPDNESILEVLKTE